jgi:hypothetical protein
MALISASSTFHRVIGDGRLILIGTFLCRIISLLHKDPLRKLRLHLPHRQPVEGRQRPRRILKRLMLCRLV